MKDRLGGRIEDAVSVRITTTTLGKNVFALTVFCPPQQAVDIEQRLTQYLMTAWYVLAENAKIPVTIQLTLFFAKSGVKSAHLVD